MGSPDAFIDQRSALEVRYKKSPAIHADFFHQNAEIFPKSSRVGYGVGNTLILPLFSGLLKPPVMRTSCLAAGPLSSVAQTSLG